MSEPVTTMYRGKVIVRGQDGAIWDVVDAELRPTPNEPHPWGGDLYPKPGASLSWWSGPVRLELPGYGKANVQVSPAGDAKKPLSRVAGNGQAPWVEAVVAEG